MAQHLIHIAVLDDQAQDSIPCYDLGRNIEVGVQPDAAEIWLKQYHASLHGGPAFAALLLPHAADEQALTRVALDRLAEHFASHPGEMLAYLDNFRKESVHDDRVDLQDRIRELLGVDD